MNDCPLVVRLTLAAVAATAVCLVVSSTVASAQSAATANDGSTRPPAASLAQTPVLSTGVGEVVKMYQGGINRDVIVNYINSTALPYHLNADGIIYLQALGMPQEITKAMILRDGQMQQQQANQGYYRPQPMPGAMPAPYGNVPMQPPIQVAVPTTPAPDATMIGSDYPGYDYGYPYNYYGGPYYGGPYYGWPLVVGGGWGWGRGWGYGGFRGGFGGFRGGGGFGGFHGGGGFGGFRGGGGGFHGGFSGGHGGGHAGGHGGGHR
jgi:hypothetical protein